MKYGTSSIDAQFETGDIGWITRDSGAGVYVRSEDRLKGIAMLSRHDGLRMCSANGTEIQNLGRKIIRFRGNDVRKSGAETSGFGRRA